MSIHQFPEACLKEILEGLGAKVILLGFSPEFVSVDTEAIRPEDIILAKKWAGEYPHIDSIVSTDGDGDRPLVSDEFGSWLKGDIVGVLVAKYMGINSIATPVSSNTVAEKINYFKNIERTKIGSPYVIEAMNVLLEEKNNKVGGYEANGGFLLANDISSANGNKMTALPTRDAVLPILAVILMSVEANCTISKLLAELPARYTASSKIDNFATEKSQEILGLVQKNDSTLAAKIIFEYFSGNNSVKHIDFTDGIRITLATDDIIHLRASGNAPELRCYTESSTESKAKNLNDYCISILKVM